MSQNFPLIIGPYLATQELGRGKNTVVYKAQQTTRNNRNVALKVLQSHDEATWQRFQNEARLSARLNDTGVRRIYDAGRTPQGFPYVAMEFVDTSLKALLHQRFAQKRPFTREEVYQLLAPVADALDTLHQRKVVHLDIKPDNILVNNDGHAMLADFGISQPQGTTSHAGTPRYMSPEQAAANRPVGPWSDVYSFACMIYEMLTGRPPFLGDMEMTLVHHHLEETPPAPRQFNPAIDPVLEETLMGALSKTPNQRPKSATALLQAVRGKSSPSIPIWIPIVALFVVAVGIILMVVLSRPENTTPTPIPTTASVATTVAPPTKDATTPTPNAPATSTPGVTATRDHVTRTPTPTVVASKPQLLFPGNGSQQEIKVLTLTWKGSPNVDWQIYLYHQDSKNSLHCIEKTATSCKVDLPGELFGEWRWRVQAPSGTLSSEEWHFYFMP